MMRRSVRATVVGGLAVFVAGCGLLEPDLWDDRQAELDRNRALWESAGVDSYVYDLDTSCYGCGAGEVTITVRDGIVTGAVRSDGEPLPEEWLTTVETVDSLFDRVARAIDGRAYRLEVRYDPELGYPTLIDLDPDRNAIDEEIRYEASDLTPLVSASVEPGVLAEQERQVCTVPEWLRVHPATEQQRAGLAA